MEKISLLFVIIAILAAVGSALISCNGSDTPTPPVGDGTPARVDGTPGPLPPASVDGVVKNEQGEPVSGVEIFVDWLEGGSEPTTVGQATTDSLGHARFEDVAVDGRQYQVRIEVPEPMSVLEDNPGQPFPGGGDTVTVQFTLTE